MFTTESRKRKQDDMSKLSSSMPTNWSDFIYSSPSSPSVDNVLYDHPTSQQSHVEPNNGTNSRRHSVAVGELDYHSFDLNMLPHFLDERPVHKRAMSLREDDLALNNPLFSPSFLEALMSENTRPRGLSIDNSVTSDFSLHDLSSSDLFKFNTNEQTITPSATITNEINLMADWLLEQDEQHILKRQRRTTDSPLGSSSSSSSSPPITPMQQASLGFEEQDETSLQPLIQNYLLQKHQNFIPGEKTVTILTSRVAQKSYGTEKRFLCPPPATILKGANWWTTDKLTDKNSPSNFKSQTNALQSPKLTIQISGETIQQSGTIEWQDSHSAIRDKKLIKDNLTTFGRCVSKQLFINDADEKRKRVEVLANIHLANGLLLGTFQSKGIKVISKPSKKRQSVKNMELCIHHGTTISLFNRIRSQTVSTKYLGVSTNQLDSSNGTCFVSRTGTWDPFVIWIVDTSCTSENINKPKHNSTNPDYPPSPAIALQSYSPLAIHYNQPVVLQCVTTGLVSPVMIIRKVDKQSLVLGGNSVSQSSQTQTLGGECSDETLGDPVSQLHKVAFQIVQDPSFHQGNTQQEDIVPRWKIPQSSHPVTYLACLNDVVGMHKTTSTRDLVPQCQEQLPAEPWSDLVPKEPLRRLSNSESKGRRGSLGKSSGLLVDGLEGACWTEDVSDAAVWTIVGTDSASYTFWTPPDRQPTSISSFPILHQVTQQGDYLIMSGENFSHDMEVWFGDIKSSLTDYISGESIHCKIPVITHSPTIEQDDPTTKKIPLLLVRGNGVVHKTNTYHIL
ncbi:unnamed protein product [Rhizopus stolonifer]